MKSLNNWLKEKLGSEPKSEKTSQPSQKSEGDQKSDHDQRRRRFGPKRGESSVRNPGKTPFKKEARRNSSVHQSSRTPRRLPASSFQLPADSFRIVIIGGLNEVGRNCAVFETKNDMVMIDCGLMFPDENMFGVDYVIPDIAYVEERLHKLRAVLLTHGHLDHIGGLRHVLPKLKYPPIYGSKMTIGLVEKNLEEYKQLHLAKLHEVTDAETLRIGSFTAGFIKVTHSVPGSFAIDLRNGSHRIIHTGDFKFDFTAPFPNDIPDFERLAQAGEEGVTFLMSDSTNATIDGYTRPEVTVADSLREIITKPQGRIIIGTVSSNIARIQNMVNVAKEVNRQVFIAGRSMVNNVEIAKKLQYMNWSENHVRKLTNAANDLPDGKVLIITTGSQGEEFAALNRMANDTHMQIKVKAGDTIAFSASPIPGTGNERSVTNMINKFIAKGANVVTNEDLDLHSSGHGKKEDLKMMLSLVTPKYFIPVHGELFMRLAHKNLAIETGMKDEDVYLLENGSMMEIAPSTQHPAISSREETIKNKQQKDLSAGDLAKEDGNVLFDEGGQGGFSRPYVHEKLLPIRNIYIDGLGGTENEDDHVLQDRKTMSRDGVAIVLFRVSRRDHALQGLPKIISKGFIYLDEHVELTGDIAREAAKAYEKATSVIARSEATKQSQTAPLKQGEVEGVSKNSKKNFSSIKSHRDLRSGIRFHLSKYISKKIDREPVIVPIIVEV